MIGKKSFICIIEIYDYCESTTLQNQLVNTFLQLLQVFDITVLIENQIDS